MLLEVYVVTIPPVLDMLKVLIGVIPLVSSEAGPVPLEVIPYTRKLYAVPFSKPVTSFDVLLLFVCTLSGVAGHEAVDSLYSIL